MNKISKRLELISSLVSDNSIVGDIGCDHGLLDIYLYQNKKNIKIIATDINNNALDNARINIKNNNLSDKIEVRLGFGLEPYKINEVDTIILAGMGTYTILDILKKDYAKLNSINNIVVQSNTKIELLRREISKMGYYIDNEYMIIDKGIYYTIISFKKGKRRYNKYELYFGPILINNHDDVFINYHNKEYNRLKSIYDNLSFSKIIDKYKIKTKINMYKKILLLK